MAQVIVTFRIMPDSPKVNLKWIAGQASKLIADFGGNVGKTEEQPIAFGINSLNIFFVMDEKKGSTQHLEEKIAKIAGVASIEVTDVRRAIG